MIYPPRCLGCGGMVESDFGLCGPCWRDTQFIGGLTCDTCGTPLPGFDTGPAHCDECIARPPPWSRGRATLIYAGNGRRMVLALKHGDRQDITAGAALWMARAARPLLLPGMIAAPVPLHCTRLLKRRYNQSALLGRAMARQAGIGWCPDLLIRTRATQSLDGKGRDARHEALAGAIRLHPRRRQIAAGRPVLLVDDVMTSGATLGACSDALGDTASSVSVIALARVVRDT